MCQADVSSNACPFHVDMLTSYTDVIAECDNLICWQELSEIFVHCTNSHTPSLVETDCCASANHLIFAQFVWCYLAFSFHFSVAAMEKLKFIQHSAELAKLTGNCYCRDFFTVTDISDQIRKLDASCSIRTKDEHADRCHVILTSFVILHII